RVGKDGERAAVGGIILVLRGVVGIIRLAFQAGGIVPCLVGADGANHGASGQAVASIGEVSRDGDGAAEAVKLHADSVQEVVQRGGHVSTRIMQKLRNVACIVGRLAQTVETVVVVMSD